MSHQNDNKDSAHEVTLRHLSQLGKNYFKGRNKFGPSSLKSIETTLNLVGLDF